jgi:hypothetical protein
MPDLSHLFRDLLTKEGLLEDFETKVLPSSLVGQVLQHLGAHRRCVVSGRPRSGKTNLAYRVAGDIEKNELPGGAHQVRWLDLSSLPRRRDEQLQTFFPQACFAPEWLLVFDNWHARPEYHGDLNEMVERNWRVGISVLYCVTQFPTEDDVSDGLPRLDAWGSEPLPGVDTDAAVAEVGQAMILQRLSEVQPKPIRYFIPAAHPRSLTEEEIEQALTAPSSLKRLRGNLRYLRWRLAAWQPGETRLAEVVDDHVLNTVESVLIDPFRESVGTIESVAAVAQWEQPYLRPLGEDPPEAVMQLQRRGFLVIEGNFIRMDSTDAFLWLRAFHRSKWEEKTRGLLDLYLTREPTQAYVLLRAVLAQAQLDSMTELITSSLKSLLVRQQFAAGLQEAFKSESVGNGALLKLINAVLRRLPDNPTERESRIQSLGEILSTDLGKQVGEKMRGKNTRALRWLLMHLAKDEAAFASFGRSVVQGYGRNQLAQAVHREKSGSVQRATLDLVDKFDHDTATFVAKLQPLKPPSDLQELSNWLLNGTVATGTFRREKVLALAAIDGDVLAEGLRRCKKPFDVLQRVIQAAIWLSPDEARRLAQIVPQLLPRLESRSAKAWSFLITNLYSANASAAAEAVDYVLAQPAGEFLQGDRGPQGRLLAAIEKAQPGSVQTWVGAANPALGLALTAPDRGSVDELLVPAALFAGASVARLMNNWRPSAGALAVCGLPTERLHCDQGACVVGANVVPPAQLLSGLFHLKLTRPDEFRLVAESLSQARTPALVAMARLQTSWTPEAVGNVMRRILRGAGPERGVEGTIQTVDALRKVQWPVGFVFDKKDGHRGLQSCLEKKILRLTVDEPRQTVAVDLNRKHPVVENVLARIERVFVAMGAQPITLANWDGALGRRMSPTEADAWRSRLIASGAVHAKFDWVNDGEYTMTFERGSVDEDAAYRRLGLRD